MACLGGVAAFLVSLVVTRSLTVHGPRRLGVSLKLGAAAIVLCLLRAECALPPVLAAGVLTVVLTAVEVAERMLFQAVEPAS